MCVRASRAAKEPRDRQHRGHCPGAEHTSRAVQTDPMGRGDPSRPGKGLRLFVLGAMVLSTGSSALHQHRRDNGGVKAEENEGGDDEPASTSPQPKRSRVRRRALGSTSTEHFLFRKCGGRSGAYSGKCSPPPGLKARMALPAHLPRLYVSTAVPLLTKRLNSTCRRVAGFGFTAAFDRDRHHISGP